MVVFITGATGFIGSHVTRELLNRGYELRALVRKTSNISVIKDERIELVYGDITSPLPKKYLRDVDIIIHLAALVQTGYFQDYSRLYKINVVGTKNLAEAALSVGGIRRFIFFSSIAAIGIRNMEKLVDENVECFPDTLYGKSKYEAERLLMKYYEENGLPVIILRLPTVYGPGEKYNFLKLVKAIKSKIFVFVGSGENMTSTLYVKNLAKELWKIIEFGRKGEVYHLADKRPFKWIELINLIAQALGVKPPRLHVCPIIAGFIAVPLEMIAKALHFEPILYRGRVKTLTANFALDIKKAVRDVGYNPTIPTEVGIKETINWYEENGLL